MSSIKKKVGLFGGTFDPVHNGHIAIANTVLNKLGLARVIFIPAGQPWLKEGRQITPAANRVKMVELAIAGEPHFEVSTIEVERPGATYTVDTLEELVKNMGGMELYVIVGMDSLIGFPAWKDPVRLLELGYLVVVPRPGYTIPDLKAMEKVVPAIHDRLILLDKPEIDISASEIRRRVAENLPFEDMVPPKVAEYIKQNKLYKQGAV